MAVNADGATAAGRSAGPGRAAWHRGTHPAPHPRGRAGRAPRLPAGPHRRRDHGAVPRPGPGPPDRHRGDRAAAPGRAGHLGLAARPGGRADRLGPGAAAAGHGLPDLPRARRRLVPRRRPGEAARAVPRGQPRRLGPGRAQLPPVHDRDRRPDPARHRLRDGHPAGRRGGRGRRGGHRLLRRRRDQPGRRQRGVHLGVGVQRPGRVLLPEQPVGDLRAAGAAEPDPAVPAGQRLRLPRRPGRRQRRARLPRGHPEGAAGGPRGPGPDADRGVHLPDGRAHHHRRPDPVPAGQPSSRRGS